MSEYDYILPHNRDDTSKQIRIDRNSVEYKYENDLNRLLDEAEFGLSDTTMASLSNILVDKTYYSSEHPLYEFLRIMRQPEYFATTCKWLLNITLSPFQTVILQTLWKHKFPMLLMTRGGSKTFLLGIYVLLFEFFNQGSKVAIVGSAFRQSKLVFEAMERIWLSSKILKSIVPGSRGSKGFVNSGPKRNVDRHTFYIGKSEAIALPMGDGETIRGIRANCVVADEFASIQRDIFEVVVRGFGSVSSNPVDRARKFSKMKKLKELGHDEVADEIKKDIGTGNQIILSGTASYQFNHFYEYWDRYHKIITSEGNPVILNEAFKGEIPKNFDYRDYAIIRVPHQILPDGFMDEVYLAQAQATVNKMLFQMEYGCCFPTDSDGFFRRTLIEACTCKPSVETPSGPISFDASIVGENGKIYVYGIDPASEKDNFAIIILEVTPTHRKVVYCWTASREKMRKRLKKVGKDQIDQSFYNYCIKKIRQLMKVFPTEHIGIDGQGGGITIVEGLHDKDTLGDGGLPVWEYIKKGDKDVFWWEKPDKPTDGEFGRHILHVVQFADAKFTKEAHHGLRFDMESKQILFPMFDSLLLSRAITDDSNAGRDYDTLEDCLFELEELKNEMVTIVHEQTATGRDRWDTPTLKAAGGKVVRLRKDRCTALIIANMIARTMYMTSTIPEYQSSGGYAIKQGNTAYKEKSGNLYSGPSHYTEKMNSYIPRGVYGRR